jgi:hypothetical protein
MSTEWKGASCWIASTSTTTYWKDYVEFESLEFEFEYQKIINMRHAFASTCGLFFGPRASDLLCTYSTYLKASLLEKPFCP